MLYELLNWIDQQFNIPGFGVFHYLTFRAILAATFSLLISLFIGKKIIKYLQIKLIGESIRDVGPASHASKKGTPTMGGIIIIISIVIPTLLWGNLKSPYVLLLLLGTVWMGTVGFLDDYIKVFKKNKAGLKGKFKVIGQVVLGLIVGLTVVLHPSFEGLQSRIDNQREIHPNILLKKAGFQENDKLISIDGKNYNQIPSGTSSPKIALYVVERQGKTIQIYVPKDERLRVSEMLFGTKQYGFVTSTNIPFYKDTVFNYSTFAFWEEGNNGWGTKLIYILVVIFIVTAVSNGVNITDGIDGLAAGTTAIVAGTLAIFAYVSGNILFSSYLNISFIPQAGEMFVFCAALIGACIGFLWYNAFPAQVFMGDTGSLALGGAVGVLAILVKKELLLPLICGIFFIENLSVIIQVSYFKYTKKKYGEGKRIFKMAPIHHHFELSGIHESKIVTRFMIITLLLEILAFATLKLR